MSWSKSCGHLVRETQVLGVSLLLTPQLHTHGTSTASHWAPCSPCGHMLLTLVVAEQPPVSHSRNLSHAVVHCNSPGGECSGVFPTAQALECSCPDTLAYSQQPSLPTPRPKVCRRALGNTVSARCQLLPNLVHVVSRPVWPSVSFENTIHLIAFWEAGFVACLPESHRRPPLEVTFTLQSRVISKTCVNTLPQSALRFRISA